MSSKILRTADITELVKRELTCGDCRGLSRDVLIPASPKPCASLGKLEDSKTCRHFRTNTFQLKEMMEEHGDELVGLFQLFSKLDEKDLRAMAGMLLSESQTRKQGVKMGQPIFVRYRGRESRNYMNNFMAARILDMDDKEVRLISETGNIVLTYQNTGLNGPSLYSKAEFKKLSKKMKEEDKLIDPEREIKTVKKYLPDEDVKFKAPTALDGYSVPSMDDIVKGKGGKKKRRTNTLVDIVEMIDRGHSLGADIDEDEGSVDLGANSYKQGKTKKKKSFAKGPIELSDMGK